MHQIDWCTFVLCTVSCYWLSWLCVCVCVLGSCCLPFLVCVCRSSASVLSVCVSVAGWKQSRCRNHELSSIPYSARRPVIQSCCLVLLLVLWIPMVMLCAVCHAHDNDDALPLVVAHDHEYNDALPCAVAHDHAHDHDALFLLLMEMMMLCPVLWPMPMMMIMMLCSCCCSCLAPCTLQCFQKNIVYISKNMQRATWTSATIHSST